MKRPDLPSGFDGWQVVDATPQETSSGKAGLAWTLSGHLLKFLSVNPGHGQRAKSLNPAVTN